MNANQRLLTSENAIVEKHRSSKPRLLFVVAGTKRNAGKDSPTRLLLESKKLADVDRVYICAPEDDPDGQATAKALQKMLPRHPIIVSVPSHKGDHHSRKLARIPHLNAVEKLLAGTLKGHLEDREFVVSSLTGSAAQWSLLFEALEEHGASPRLLYETNEGVHFLDQGPAQAEAGPTQSRRGRRTLDQHLKVLENVPDSGVVLVTGETGAGKSHFARLLHERWKGSSNLRFRSVDCGALPENLVESELFGSKRGAFTGAEDRPGAFDDANGGTLFLDEIGEVNERVQGKLLTVLDVDENGMRTYRGVGGAEKKAKLRLVLGTNRDLLDYVAEHRFRLDLLARISTHEVWLPPLRQTLQRIPGIYLDQFESLSEAYTRHLGEPAVRARFRGNTAPSKVQFMLPVTSFEVLFEFLARAQDWWWPWNRRDVQQSAQRLALAAWNAAAIDRRTGRLQIHKETLLEEFAFLEERWQGLRAREHREDAWADLERLHGKEKVARWSVLERHEVRAVLRAHERSDNDAEAYRAFWRAMNPDSPETRRANPTALWRQILRRLNLELSGRPRRVGR